MIKDKWELNKKDFFMFETLNNSLFGKFITIYIIEVIFIFIFAILYEYTKSIPTLIGLIIYILFAIDLLIRSTLNQKKLYNKFDIEYKYFKYK